MMTAGEKEKLERVFKLYSFETGSFSAFGEGHINKTYKVDTATKSFVLQQINTSLFTDIDALMNNICFVTDFMRSRLGGGDPRRVLTVVNSLDGRKSVEVDGESFRIFDYIFDSVCYQIVDTPEHFYEAARAFGKFAELLGDIDATKLYEVIPHFHDTPKRLRDFKAAVCADKFGRAKAVEREIEFFLNREGKYANVIVDALASGAIPVRVTHNDTKLNNVMIDAATGKGLCVVDLDTVMQGSVLYDFGDSIRFGCNTAAEDEQDLNKVVFSLDLFKTYLDGYLSEFKSIESAEKAMLPLSAIIMTYECGSRFLADYLNGDEYFNTARSGQNLDRARTQIKLIADMERGYEKMMRFVK